MVFNISEPLEPTCLTQDHMIPYLERGPNRLGNMGKIREIQVTAKRMPLNYLWKTIYSEDIELMVLKISPIFQYVNTLFPN